MSKAKSKVHFTGGDGCGWALDEDLRLLRKAAESVVAFAPAEQAEVVHSVWWDPLSTMPLGSLKGRRVLCHLSGELARYEAMPRFTELRPRVGLWIARSQRGMRELAVAGLPSAFIPYLVDPHIFRRLENREAIEALRIRWRIPSDRYLVGSFQRDTEGRDLGRPKLVKGPDIFLSAIIEAKAQGVPIHVVLAGPRRHWLRAQLRAAGIPLTFVGTETEADDYPVNNADRATLNALYNIVDTYVVSSRSEGGPHAILEATASRCPVISTRVGIADEVLEPESLFFDASGAAHLLGKDSRERDLSKGVEAAFSRVQMKHTPEAGRAYVSEVYANLDKVPFYATRRHLWAQLRTWRAWR